MTLNTTTLYSSRPSHNHASFKFFVRRSIVHTYLIWSTIVLSFWKSKQKLIWRYNHNSFGACMGCTIILSATPTSALLIKYLKAAKDNFLYQIWVKSTFTGEIMQPLLICFLIWIWIFPKVGFTQIWYKNWTLFCIYKFQMNIIPIME